MLRPLLTIHRCTSCTKTIKIIIWLLKCENTVLSYLQGLAQTQRQQAAAAVVVAAVIPVGSQGIACPIVQKIAFFAINKLEIGILLLKLKYHIAKRIDSGFVRNASGKEESIDIVVGSN